MVNAYKSSYTGEEIDNAVGNALKLPDISVTGEEIDNAVTRINDRKYLHQISITAKNHRMQATFQIIIPTNIEIKRIDVLNNTLLVNKIGLSILVEAEQAIRLIWTENYRLYTTHPSYGNIPMSDTEYVVTDIIL